MKPIKTFLIATTISFAVTNFAIAQNSYAEEKVAVVKSIYARYKSSPMTDSLPFVQKNVFTQSFDALLEKDSEMSKGEIACIDYDYIIQGQDYDGEEISRTIKFTPQDDGRVKVTFTNFKEPKTLYYVFSCKNGNCLIDDIIEPTGSFKKSLGECLKKLNK